MKSRMNRREALQQAGRFAGVAAVWASLPMRSGAALPAPAGWSPGEEALLTLIGDTILPATPGSPGAGAVEIGRFIAMMANDCQEPGVAATIRLGLRDIEGASRAKAGRSFSELAPAEREAVLTAYETRAPGVAAGWAVNPFRKIKELTILGYFTSEPGATTAVRYDPVPGAYHGSVRLGPGDRCWAT